MRGIAAARSREANARLDGVRAYAQTVGGGIAQTLALLPGGAPPPANVGARRHVLIALCAEQGFAGAFDSRVWDAVADLTGATGPDQAEIILVGDHGAMTAAERGIAVAATLPMAAHADEVPALADRLSELLLDRARLGQEMRATLVHGLPGTAAPESVVRKPLLPFDYARFPPVSRTVSPIVTLPPASLLARLAEEYLFAELCEALLFSHAAENEARMRAMVAARDNVASKLEELTGRSRLLRQEAITNEVIELASHAHG
jgi:F-type H+-transporting ATPase subunit gamma